MNAYDKFIQQHYGPDDDELERRQNERDADAEARADEKREHLEPEHDIN